MIILTILSVSMAIAIAPSILYVTQHERQNMALMVTMKINDEWCSDFNFDKIKTIDTTFVDTNRLAVLCELYTKITMKQTLQSRKRLQSKHNQKKQKKWKQRRQQ